MSKLNIQQLVETVSQLKKQDRHTKLDNDGESNSDETHSRTDSIYYYDPEKEHLIEQPVSP